MAQSSTQFTIFYAWQSDTPAPHNRTLIEKALEAARDELGAHRSVPYEIKLVSDTKGLPGLCDIPNAILERLASADAVVLDLTYVASTAGTDPKYCPNPNVLFELGYAFHAVGHKRLVCVMNEHYGPATKILFDIAHRRHPVRYTSPANGRTRKQVIASLGHALADALEATVLLGPQSRGAEDRQEFESESAEIRDFWQGRRDKRNVSWPTVHLVMRPVRYQERRWPDAETLEAILQKHEIISGRHEVPPSRTGTAVTPWGLYNDAYGTSSWALTYSGQFWAAIEVASEVKHPLSQRHRMLEPTVGIAELAPGRWLDYVHVQGALAEMFRFTSSLARAFEGAERLSWSATAEGIAGTRLGTTDPRFGSECSLECVSPRARKDAVAPAADIAADWKARCEDFVHELFSMYDFHGRRISRATIAKYLDPWPS